MRALTEKQYRHLLVLGSGAAQVIGRKRETEALLRRDLVTAEEFRDGYYTWIRITPVGLRALADCVERYGLPEMKPMTKAARAA